MKNFIESSDNNIRKLAGLRIDTSGESMIIRKLKMFN